VRALRGSTATVAQRACWLLAITRNTAFTWMARNRPKALLVTEDIEALAPADEAATPESLDEKATQRQSSARSALCRRPLRRRSCCATLMD